MRTAADRLRHEGRVQGREEGRIDLLRRLLERRFGPLAPDIDARLRGATVSQLDQWADALLTAATLEGVFES